MAKFSDMLSRLPAVDRQLVLHKLSLLGNRATRNKHAVINFHAECRLPETAYEALFRVIAHTPDDVFELRTSITVCLRSFVLNGPPIHFPTGQQFGRAYPQNKFIEYLSFGHGARHTTRENARYELAFLRNHDNQLEEIHRRWGSLNFGRYLSWSTFCPHGGDPFDGIEPNGQTVAAVLGLEKDSIEKSLQDQGSLLLFIYTLPSEATPRFPTIADAYSADDWPYYFHVAHEDDPYPSTVGWYEGKNLPPRPEVVHEVIRFNQLCKPIRMV